AGACRPARPHPRLLRGGRRRPARRAARRARAGGPRMTLAQALPSVNAAMNAVSACALFAGWVAIRRRNFGLHWKLMATAFAASVLFLAGYLTRFALTGVHRFPLGGSVRTFYYVLLGTH